MTSNKLPFMAKNMMASPGSPDSQMSDISFPSHISDLESFLDETSNIGNEEMFMKICGKEERDYFQDIPKLKEESSQESISAFLKISSPPKSTSNSNSLNESSMSFSKFEAMQGDLQDSFLNSQSEDSEREKKLELYLNEAKYTSEKSDSARTISLCDAIDHSSQPYVLGNEETEVLRGNNTEAPMNQTEMDSLFMKELRERLEMTEANEANESQLADITLRALEDDDVEINNTVINDLQEGLQLIISNAALNQPDVINDIDDEVFDRGRIESVERPNLDGGSSSESDDGISTTTTNFARSGVQTRVLASNMLRYNEVMNAENIPERQTAEGSEEEVHGDDGGGGGDGSSGHSDSDIGGDGGVAIRNTRLVVNTQFQCDDSTMDERVTPPNRERPVGGSGPQNRQVQFAPQLMDSASTGHDSGMVDQSSSNSEAGQTGEVDGQDSRLSARFFLAASTPFKDPTATSNWLTLNSLNPEVARHDLTRDDFTLDTPSSTMLSQLRNQHGDAPDWTFGSPTLIASKIQQDATFSDHLTTNQSNFQPTDFPASSSQSQVVYNPFETISTTGCNVTYHNETFHSAKEQDLEVLFDEDEKVIAQNNNSVYKDTDQTADSDWTVNSENYRIHSAMLASVNEDGGRVSNYFMLKSNELGSLSNNENGPRPNFSDDSHVIKTPPSNEPQPLLASLKPNEFSFPWSNANEMVTHIETPKTSLSTHKRTSDTVLKKREKRQLVGLDHGDASMPRLTDGIISTPVTNKEADSLLVDIQERRVSVVGMSEKQLGNLAHMVSKGTGADLNLVLRLLSMLSKPGNICSESNQVNIEDQIKNENQTEKPISSVIPLEVEFSNRTPHHGFQETSHINQTRHSDPVPASFTHKPPTVRHFSDFATPQYQKQTLDFQPVNLCNSPQVENFHLLKTHPRESMSQFHLLTGPTCDYAHNRQPGYQNNQVLTSSRQPYQESIIFQGHIQFDVCCVGTYSTKQFQMHNSNSCWMQCQLHPVFFALNGRELEKTPNQAFILPPKVSLEPHSSEDVNIKFQPHQAGTYVLKIEVLTAPLLAEHTTLTWIRVPNVMNVEAVSEFPDVEVVLDESKEINFGEVSYGSCVTKSLCVLNKGRADAPIKLCIASGSKASSFFTFNNSASNLVTNSCSVLVQGRKQAGVALNPAIVTLRFQAPSEPLQLPATSADVFSCQIDLEVESKPVVLIASITMNAKVGKARLHSLRSIQTIEMTTDVDRRVTHKVPLRNAGTIAMNIEMKVVCTLDVFSVEPSCVVIPPGGDAQANITFTSNVPTQVNGRLLVTLLPDGEQYEWNLLGTSKPITKKVEMAMLLCNKVALNWSGVAVGYSKQQKLIFRNSSPTQSINLSISISNNHSDFQIQNNIILQQKEVNKFEASLKPKAELPVYVLFTPSAVDMVTGSLILRVINGTTKFVIPLAGYGGTSNLEINGTRRVNDQFWIDMGSVASGKNTVVNTTLRNSGVRSSFVSIKCYSDIATRLEYPKSHLQLSANNFVLAEKSTQKVTIVYEPVNDTKDGSTYTAAHLVIISGDEVMRKLYRTQAMKVVRPDLMSLNKTFINETETFELNYHGFVTDWESFFQSHVSRTVIAMVATPWRQIEVGKPDFVDSLQKDILATPAHKLNDDCLVPSADCSPSMKPSNAWTLTPHEIILSASTDAPSTKVQLTNYTEQALPFEFIWPAQTLVITPCKEKIPARSHLSVRINAKPSFLSTPDDIPWKGNVYVLCNNQQKGIQVHIRSDMINELTPAPQKRMDPLESHDVSLVPHHEDEQDKNIVISPHILEFANTTLNLNADASFHLQNMSPYTCRWILSSIAPSYFKSDSEKGEIVRATYSVFRFAKHSGKLTPKQSVKLPVSFHPRASGVYSQFWDFEAMFEYKVPSSKLRLELIGKGVLTHTRKHSPKKVGATDPIPKLKESPLDRPLPDVVAKPRENDNQPRANNNQPRANDNQPSANPKISADKHVFVKDEELVFPEIEVGKSAEMKFRLCNDSIQTQKVRVSGFRPPFSVILKHVRLSIRPKSYIRVPVYFTPTSPSTSSEGLLILSPEYGTTLYVKLLAKSS